jgi:thioesterase domain-containing protein
LISFCVLGNVALETAQQLRAAGSKAPTLFLLDTVAAVMLRV